MRWKFIQNITPTFPRKWLNWTEKFSSVQKFTFLVNFELNSVHFFAEGTWTELSSVFEWTWTKNEQKSSVHFSIIKTKISWHILIKKCGYHCQFLFIKNSKLFLKKLIIFKTLPYKNTSRFWLGSNFDILSLEIFFKWTEKWTKKFFFKFVNWTQFRF